MIKKTLLVLLAQVSSSFLLYAQELPSPSKTDESLERVVAPSAPSQSFYSYFKNIGLGIGGLNTSPFSSVKNQDHKNTIDPNLSMSLTGRWNIKNQHYFIPEFTYVYYPKYQSEYSKNISIYSLIFMSNVWKDLYLRYGISTFITTIWGSVGTKQLNDGGTVSTYYLPGDVGKSYNTTPTLGSEYLLKNHVAIRLDTYLLSAWSKTARQIWYSTSLHYYF